MKHKNLFCRNFYRLSLLCSFIILLFCFSFLHQPKRFSAADSWPPESLLVHYDPRDPDTAVIDYDHHLVIYRFDMYQTTSGASRERVEGRDFFDPANIYPDTDFTVSFFKGWKEPEDLPLKYDYYPRSAENRHCWASSTIEGDRIMTITLQVELTGVDGALRQQISSIYENGWVTVPAVEANTPYAERARFSGYRVQFGNVASTWDELFLAPNSQ